MTKPNRRSDISVVKLVTLAEASQILALSRSSIYRWKNAQKLGPLIGAYPGLVRVSQLEALLGYRLSADKHNHIARERRRRGRHVDLS